MFNILKLIKNARNTAKTAGSKASDRQECEGTELGSNFGGDAGGTVGTGEEGWVFGEARFKYWWWFGINYDDIMLLTCAAAAGVILWCHC